MTQAAKAQEPSMEEILASIRRIISDDETKPPVRAAEPAKPAAPPPASPEATDRAMPSEPPPSSEFDSLVASPEPQPRGVFELTEDMTAPPPGSEAFRTIDGQSDVIFTDPPEPEPPEPAADTGPPASPLTRDDRLLSGSTTASVDSAFNSLAHAVLAQNARTLEDLVREMLRPMLKTWLDDNLPGLVERLVRAEIERVSRGRS